MKMFKSIPIIFLLILFSGCNLIPELPRINTDTLSDDQKKSLASTKQISAFPFFVMHYFGNADENHLEMMREALGIKSRACTTFTSYNEKNELLLSRNHDWPENPVLILFSHPKGKLSSVSLVDLSVLGYTKKSKFESLKDRSNLLYSIYAPMDGMNEKGVAIGAMGCVGLDSENRNPIAFSTEVIRLILDNAENVNEAIDIFHKHSIHNVIIPLHYLVSDSDGNSAVVEYINGKVLVQDLSRDSKVLTNFQYYGSAIDVEKKSAEYLSTGKVSNDTYGDSYLRYIKVKQRLVESKGRVSETDSMKLLEAVSMKQKTMYGDFYTVWSVVYNLKTKTVDISVGRDYGKVFNFELGS